MDLRRRRERGLRERLAIRARDLLGRAITRALDALDGAGGSSGAARAPSAAERAGRTRVVSARADDAKLAPVEGTPSAEGIELSMVDDDTLRVRWGVDDEAMRRARSLLAGEGELCVRLVVVSADALGEVLRDERERPAQKVGEWRVDDLPDGAQLTASVGLSTGSRYVSVAHTPVLAWSRSTDRN